MLHEVNGIHAQQITRHYNRSIAFQLPSPLSATHLDISCSLPSYSTPISPPTTHAGYWAIQPGCWSLLLGIPHYLTIVKHLMDSSMIDVRLTVSDPSKPDPNHSVAWYSSIQEFITDKLVFDNCYLFNGPDHVISQCARWLQAMFEQSLSNMPPPQVVTPEQIILPRK